MTTPVVTRRIADLKPHPRQSEYFCDSPSDDIRELVEDIRRHGLRSPVLILADGTIVSGHRRVEAFKILKRTEIDVVVVPTSKEDPLAEGLFIRENSNRRQLSRLQRARCARRLQELAYRGKFSPHGQMHGRVRDQIGQALGIHGREAARLLRVLDAPLTVQRAYDAGLVSLVLAGRVAGLPAGAQQEIDEAIKRDGAESAKKSILAHIATKPAKVDLLAQEYHELLAKLQRATSRLEGRVETLGVKESDLPELGRGHRLLGEMVRHGKKAAARHRRSVEAVVKRFGKNER